MAKKLTALQKRQRKERERKERAAYARGEIAPQVGKSKAAKAAARALYAEQQRSVTAHRRRSAADTARLSAGELVSDVYKLWNDAYARYRALLNAGAPNAATAVYESQFAGMNPESNTLNTNRAIAAQLRHWLRRKDSRPTRAKKIRQNTLNYVRTHGFPDIRDSELSGFWESYEKFVEWFGGVPSGLSNYVKAFASAYSKYRENPEQSQTELFQEAARNMYEYAANESFAFPSSPLG